MVKNIEDAKKVIFLYVWRLIISALAIGIGIYVILFVPYDINIIITSRTCGALMILAGLWHFYFIKKFPILCSVVSWILTWLAYFMAYDNLRLWSYYFVIIGSFYLFCGGMELCNYQIEKEFEKGSNKNEKITINNGNISKSKLWITVSSIIGVLLFIGILSYYILSSYHSI